MPNAKTLLTLVGPVVLAACATTVPNSAPQGVGFGDYDDYRTQRALRESQLTGQPFQTGPAISAEASGAAPTTVAEIGPVNVGNPGISDEQSFEAVASRETIESDAARLERQRALRQQVTPGALPERPRDVGPNIVEYALSTSNAVGQPAYSRRRTSEGRYQRACAQYPSADKAQEAFLASGGPERDTQGLDPDGDGFACGWNPAPFRAALRPAAPESGPAPTDAESIASEALSAVGVSQ